MSEPTHYDPYNDTGRVATACHEDDKPTHSQLLGPNGVPLQYEKPKVGFELRLRK